MQGEPFDSSLIRLAGGDPATGTREGAFRNHPIYRCLDVPPAEWMALEDTAPAAASFPAHLRTASACRRPVNRARARHQQAAPL
jgi:hypothetical protein